MRLLLVLSGILMLPTWAGAAPDWKQSWKNCKSVLAKLEDCDRAIKSGKLTGRDLGVAYRRRATRQRTLKLILSDYAEAIRLNPKDIKAYVGRAGIHNRLGKLDAVFRDASSALMLNPNHRLALIYRASYYAEKKQYGKALRDAHVVLLQEPASWVSHGLLAEIYFRSKWNHTLAWRHASAGTKIAPQYKRTWEIAIKSLVALKRYREAIATCTAAAKARKRHAWAIYERGLIYENHLKDRERAIADYRQAAKRGVKAAQKRLKELGQLQ